MKSPESKVPPRVEDPTILLATELQGALVSLQDTTSRANEALQPVLTVADRAAASLAPLRGVLRDFSTALRPVIESGWLEALQRHAPAIERALEALEHANQTVDLAMQNAETMGRLGWTFPMNASLYECVTLLHETPNGAEALDAAFANFYFESEKESLPLLLADLRQHERIAEFGPLLEEVEFGLDHEKYRLVVTALIPLFEGVARCCWTDGFWKGTAREQFFTAKIATSAPESFDRVVWSAMRAFVERLYEQNHQGDPKPLALNRHWILHGRGPADASGVDALRLIQAVHTVVSLADDEALTSQIG